MAVDTFGQMSPLVAFRESRPPSSAAAAAAAGPPDSSAGRQQNNGNGGLKSGTPPQMYTTDATMAIEEYTGTTSNNSSPTKMPTTGRSNASSTGIPMSSKHNGNNQYTSSANATNAMIRRKGLPWVLAAQIFVIFLLLAIIGFLLYKMYGEEPGKVGTSDLQQPTPFPISPFISSASPTQPLAAPKEQIKPPTESNSNNNKDHQKPPSDWPPALDTRTLQARFAKAAVVSENGICSEIGRNVLWRGGNAVDAAIAVAICIGGLNGHSAGLGGGFLMTYYRRFYGKCISIDARETAPSRTNRDTFSSIPEEIISGYKSVAVPGELHGLWTAFKRFGSGKIAWMDLLLPTVSLLNEGYPASRHMEEVLKEFAGTILNGTAPGMRAQFVNPGTGLLYREGEIIRNPVLAETLRRLATSHDPVQLFYSQSGEMARTIADEFAQNGGFLNSKDLHSYRSVVDEQPLLNTQAHPRLVFCGPKPSSGFAVAQLILAIMLKFYPPGSAPTTPWTSVEYWHRLVEAQKYAFALRTKLGDGHFLKEAIQLALNMTESAFVDQITAKIGTKASNYADFGFMHTGDIEAFINEDGTSQLAVVDADGNALSMTHSLNNAFGSVVRSPQLGIVWNNHMDDFSVPGLANDTFGFAPSRANFIEPGKRPMSSMSPLVVYDRESRKVKMAIGASGGPKIPSAVAQVLSQVLSFNHSLKLAIDTPRLHNQFTPFDSHYEAGFPQQFVHELAERFGHGQLQGMDFPIANVHGILRAEGKEEEFLVASNDHRRKILSYPVGY